MKVIGYERYGPPEVLHLKEVPNPIPKPNEVLVKVHATTVTIGDVIMRSFKLPIPWWQAIFARLYLGIWQPKRKILGMELAGEIKAVGDAVTKFKPGDQVFASTFSVNFGGYAEYKCFPEMGMLAIKPTNLSYGEAADSGNGEKLEDLCFIGELAAAGHLRPVIDRTYPFDQIVAAHRYVEQGHKKGNVVITVAPTETHKGDRHDNE